MKLRTIINISVDIREVKPCHGAQFIKEWMYSIRSYPIIRRLIGMKENERGACIPICSMSLFAFGCAS